MKGKEQKMKKLKYCITFPDGNKIYEEVEAADVIEGHWKIHRKYEGKNIRSCWVKK